MNSQEVHGWLDADITPPSPHLQASIPQASIPQRDTIINADDITNLRILLNTTSSVDEFLRRI